MLQLAQKAIRAALSPFGLELTRADLGRFPEASAKDCELVATYGQYSMTTPLRQWTLLKAIQYVDRLNIPGDIVECGVWRGGNMMLAKAASSRRVWLYDTFAGMTEPTEHDVRPNGKSAIPIQKSYQKDTHNEWAYASLGEVKENFRRHDLLDKSVIFRKGMVEDTLKSERSPDNISILRLDTDWYESTLIELAMLYPKLSRGGVLIIDDYGTWLGAKKAVDEYFGDRAPYMFPVDRGCRMAVKV